MKLDVNAGIPTIPKETIERIATSAQQELQDLLKSNTLPTLAREELDSVLKNLSLTESGDPSTTQTRLSPTAVLTAFLTEARDFKRTLQNAGLSEQADLLSAKLMGFKQGVKS